MSGQTEMQSGPAASRRIALPSCHRCDELMFASMAAEFVSQSRVRHQWMCESCGHEFSTSVQLSFRRRVLS